MRNLRNGLVIALVTAVTLLGGASSSAADDGEPPSVQPYNICQFLPWWPGCI